MESLLVSCILDNTIHGRIDQVQQILELDQVLQDSARYATCMYLHACIYMCLQPTCMYLPATKACIYMLHVCFYMLHTCVYNLHACICMLHVYVHAMRHASACLCLQATCMYSHDTCMHLHATLTYNPHILTNHIHYKYVMPGILINL